MGHWTEDVESELLRTIPCGYAPLAPPCTESTALASIALLARDHRQPAKTCVEWIATLQQEDGSVGVNQNEATPSWPTGLAVLAWSAWTQRAGEASDSDAYTAALQRGADWILRTEGKALPRHPHMGHDSTLPGWSWAADTHSWIEPTAWSVLALKASGNGYHSRARFGVLLLTDRLLKTGGCNYGNTTVLGQELRPHVQPTGLTMLALAGEHDADGKIANSLDYLASELNADTTTASLCYGLIGLAAHDRIPPDYGAWLEQASRRTLRRDRSPLKLSLLLLAALAGNNSLLTMTRGTSNA